MALINLLGALGLESTQLSMKAVLDAISAKLSGTVNIGMVGRSDNNVLVGNSRSKLRDDFVHLDSAVWDTVQIGPGGSIVEEGDTTRFVTIKSGLQANAETILLSKDTFRPPFKLGFALTSNIRSASLFFYVEAVAVDENGNIEETTEFDGTETKNAKNSAGFRFTGASATGAHTVVRASGGPVLISTNLTTVSSAAQGTAPNWTPQSVYEMTMDTEEVMFGSRNVDTSNIMGTASQKRTQAVPDTEKRYKIRIRCLNGPNNLGQNVDWRLHMLRVIDQTRLSIDWMRHQGKQDASVSLPVTAVGTVTLANFSSVGISAISAARNASLTQVLAAGGTYLDTGTRFVSWSNSNDSHQAVALDIWSPTDGTLQWLNSTDGSNYYLAQEWPIVGGVGVQITRKLTAQYGRWAFVNGSTAMTAGKPLRMFRQNHLI